MKFRSKQGPNLAQQMDNSMVPMINVVFLMLIFFMVAGQIKKADPVTVIPPMSINEAQAKTEPSVLLIVQGEQLYADDQLIQLKELTSYLEGVYSLAQSKGGEEKDLFWIQIKADAQTTVDEISTVFSKIKAAGLTKVRLSTQLSPRSDSYSIEQGGQ